MNGTAKFLLYLLLVTGILGGALWIVGGRPVTVSRDIEILATADCVFTWLVDPEKRRQWADGLKETRISSRKDDGSPEAYLSTLEVRQRPVKLEERVQQYDPGKFFSISNTSGGVRRTRIFRLKPHQGGMTLSCQTVEGPAGELGRIRFALWRSDEENRIDAELRRLKQLAEKDGAPPTLFGELLIPPEK